MDNTHPEGQYNAEYIIYIPFGHVPSLWAGLGRICWKSIESGPNQLNRLNWFNWDSGGGDGGGGGAPPRWPGIQ